MAEQKPTKRFCQLFGKAELSSYLRMVEESVSDSSSGNGDQNKVRATTELLLDRVAGSLNDHIRTRWIGILAFQRSNGVDPPVCRRRASSREWKSNPSFGFDRWIE